MPLNIEDEQVHRQARRLATLTGQSLTGAVRDALAERLRQVERAQEQQPMARSPEALLAMAREIAAHMKDGEHFADHADLYDDDGLPA